MAEVSEAGYLSIGEVLGLLLEEFPDVTISKIRFLESQGLISPERTASGYRKFYDEDVERLKVILTEQRRNYLPLRVIKDRLDSGQIDPSGDQPRPNGGAAPEPTPGEPPAARVGDDGAGPADALPNDHVSAANSDIDGAEGDAEIPSTTIRAHPAGRRGKPAEPERQAPPAKSAKRSDEASAEQGRLLPGVLLDRAELCAMVGMTDGELTQLERFGIVAPRAGGGATLYADDAVEISKLACQFLRLGVDARHLRGWRTAAEREASLFEQLVTPRFRQRNPEARAEALSQLRHLDELGGQLRAALMRQALRHHFES